ncbi:MAG TPA: hypothetical protein GX723_11135 [Thermoanaerobacterales bacterium]|jgi:hypothetical protein|nr:hypothetical protein [Thermoanaerobacterales bacterium]
MNDVLINLFLTVFTILMVVGIAYLKSLANRNEEIRKALDMIQNGKQEIYNILIAELGLEQANQTIDELVKSINELENYAMVKVIEALSTLFKEKNIDIKEEQIERIANVIIAQLKVM